jgi:hypothetical protein
LPGKNLLKIGNLALWEIAAWQAIDAGASRVIISTDIEEILQRKPPPYKWVMHRRPPQLATAESRVEDTIKCILDFCEAEVVVVLNPTHPFRLVNDIRCCIAGARDRTRPSCTGVFADWHYTTKEGGSFTTLNYQERAPRYLVTGGIYAFQPMAFFDSGSMMPCDQFWPCGNLSHIDIDDPWDYAAALGIYSYWKDEIWFCPEDYGMQERGINDAG